MQEVIAVYVRIRHLREDSSMKQSEIAEILRCSQRVYSHYERGDHDIPTSILIKLAEHYNTTTDYILGRTDVKTPLPKAEAWKK